MNVGSYSNVPEELRVLPNWVVWKFTKVESSAKLTKVPYQINGHKASSTDPSHWVTFEVAFNFLSLGGFDGLGFVFTNTPYAGIDLDDPSFLADGVTVNTNYQIDLDRQIKIAHEFDSYSEVSPSGKGLHVIVKGSVVAGRKRNKVEIYSSGRFFTMTGNVHNNKPVGDYQDLLTLLWNQIGESATQPAFHIDKPEADNDETIINRALEAVNGEKFSKLLAGNREGYPTPSEADFAFIDIIGFYTQNRAQITRIFKNSKLMRPKVNSNKTYLPTMIAKSFDRQPSPIDFEGMENALELKKAASSNGKTSPFDGENAGSSPAAVATNIPIPPGLLGEIAQFLYQAAPRPVPEIALAGAIGLLAGIAGRAYNYSGTGLNQYVLVLAKTGRGKEAAASGIDKLMNSVKMQVPTSTRFRGPGIINSGQALTKYINTSSNCFVSVLGEFGVTIDRISNPYANSADKMLYSNLLDLYNKSGHGQTFQPAIYSKKEDSVGITESPSVTILGESTHKLFYGSLNEDMIAAGLLPRFLIIEYNGYRVDLNEDHYNVQPSFILQERFASLIAQCETIMAGKRVINVQADEAATKMLRNFDRSSTAKINASLDDVIAELWNRAHMKVMRLSALIAVGVNMIEPVIIPEYVEWSINLVQNDIKMLSSKFEAGEIGKHFNESKQVKEIIRMIKDFYNRDWEYISKYTKEKAMFEKKIIPYAYINKRLSGTLAFNDGRIKASLAIQSAIQVLISTDKIREIGHLDLKTFNTKQKCYFLNDIGLLDD
jgi:hypothetical protein